jgi:hypothetical protein
MIIVLSESAPPGLIDAARLDRLHAEVADSTPGTGVMFDEFCCPGPDSDHVWVSIAELRERVLVTDLALAEQFDAVIAYATTKGWLDQSGTSVRAHIERT